MAERGGGGVRGWGVSPAVRSIHQVCTQTQMQESHNLCANIHTNITSDSGAHSFICAAPCGHSYTPPPPVLTGEEMKRLFLPCELDFCPRCLKHEIGLNTEEEQRRGGRKRVKRKGGDEDGVFVHVRGKLTFMEKSVRLKNEFTI